MLFLHYYARLPHLGLGWGQKIRTELSPSQPGMIYYISALFTLKTCIKGHPVKNPPIYPQVLHKLWTKLFLQKSIHIITNLNQSFKGEILWRI
jgi:hypothetical protein